MFGLFFDKKYDSLFDELGIASFGNLIGHAKCSAAKSSNKDISGSKPEEAAVRTYRDLVLLNDKLPIEARIELGFDKYITIKALHFDGKVNVDLFMSIKSALNGLVERYVGDAYFYEFYKLLSEMGVISPITHDTLHFYSMIYLYRGKKLNQLVLYPAKDFLIEVIGANPETYSGCVKPEVHDVIKVMSKL